MLTAIFYCLTFAWTPAPGPVDSYKVFMVTDGVYQEIATVQTEQAHVCFSDQELHAIAVQAFDADGNQGPMSDASSEVAMLVEPPLYVHPLVPALQADLDGNGSVGFEDFGLFGQAFGKCNDGRQEVPCP